MPPKRSYPGPSAPKAQKRSRGSGTSQLLGRREPAASSPTPGVRHSDPQADSSTASAETADAVPTSLCSDEEPELMALKYSDDSDTCLPSSDEEDIENVRYSASVEDNSSVAATAGSSDSDSPPPVFVAPQYGIPGYGPLHSTMVDSGVPIDMMSSPGTSARARPVSPPSQREDEQSSTMSEAIPPCPLGLYRNMQLREMRRRGVHFSGFLPRHKK